ncbi:MAG: acyl carrier protein [Candidatus Dadabacteria bacterium]|nr:MAG: acyl carrier protein [Candidatus Dadabacteria bacterium]
MITALVEYVLSNHLLGGSPEDVPLDRSLVEEGILDSFEIIELVDFIERTWNIRIADEEITKENMGSIEKMAAFIARKTRS